MRGGDFNTDYWTFGTPFLAAGQAVTGDAPDNNTSGKLPAMAWVGMLIALIVIRVAYELMD